MSETAIFGESACFLVEMHTKLINTMVLKLKYTQMTPSKTMELILKEDQFFLQPFSDIVAHQ